MIDVYSVTRHENFTDVVVNTDALKEIWEKMGEKRQSYLGNDFNAWMKKVVEKIAQDFRDITGKHVEARQFTATKE